MSAKQSAIDYFREHIIAMEIVDADSKTLRAILTDRFLDDNMFELEWWIQCTLERFDIERDNPVFPYLNWDALWEKDRLDGGYTVFVREKADGTFEATAVESLIGLDFADCIDKIYYINPEILDEIEMELQVA